MDIIPSKFSQIAWNYFLLAKDIALKNNHQNVDSEHLFLSILNQGKSAKTFLEKNDINIYQTKIIIIKIINLKGKMKDLQKNIYIGDTLYKTFLKAEYHKDFSKDLVISTKHLLSGLAYDERCGELILNKKTIPEFLEDVKVMKSDNQTKIDLGSPNLSLEKFGIDLTKSARDGLLDPVIGRDEEIRRTIQILSR